MEGYLGITIINVNKYRHLTISFLNIQFSIHFYDLPIGTGGAKFLVVVVSGKAAKKSSKLVRIVVVFESCSISPSVLVVFFKDA